MHHRMLQGNLLTCLQISAVTQEQPNRLGHTTSALAVAPGGCRPAYGGVNHNLDQANRCARYPFNELSWDRAHGRYVMGLCLSG